MPMNKYAILIIDDDEITHGILEEYLELSGYSVFHAMNGFEGIEQVKKIQPDLVLLDINMPHMDGFSVMDSLNTITKDYKPQVLFLSSLDNANLKVKSLEMGAEDYIVKPFNRAELLARIRIAFRRSERYKHFEGIMEGVLGEISLVDLLQSFDNSLQTVTIEFPEMVGHVTLNKGLIHSVSQGTFNGIKAFERLIYLNHGHFQVYTNPDLTRPIQPMEHIRNHLLETLTKLDEVNRILDAGHADLLLNCSNAFDLPQEIVPLKDHFPLSIRELVVLLPGSLLENTVLIKNTVDQGILIPENTYPRMESGTGK